MAILVDKLFSKYANYFAFKSNGSTLINNAWIDIDKGIYYNSKYQPLIDSAFSKHKLRRLTGKLGPLYCRENLEIACTIAHGPWNNYYHWFIDILPRLWNLHINHSNEEKITLILNDGISTEYRSILECLIPSNVEIRYIKSNGWFKAKKAIFLPFLSKDCCGFLPKGYLDFYREKIFSLYNLNHDFIGYEKIYISRKLANKRKILNESLLEELLISKGYRVLILEGMSVSEQVLIFKNASHIVAQHGAALTNILYSKPGTKLVEIFHDRMYHHKHYKCLAKSLNIKHLAIECKSTGKNEDLIISRDVINILSNVI